MQPDDPPYAGQSEYSPFFLKVYDPLIEANNQRGVFSNLDDTKEGLGDILATSFEHVEVETVGSFAIFAARGPRSNATTQRPGSG